MGGVCAKREVEASDNAFGGKKKALVVGINYKGQGADELGGCINDAKSQYKVLTEIFGFSSSNITMLIEESGYKNPTAQNMREGLKWLTQGAVPGDVLFFSYSGHGSQMPCYDGSEADGLNEILCPMDLTQNWNENAISDNELNKIFLQQTSNGVHCLLIYDCCHSGTMTDLPLSKGFNVTPPKPRYLEPPAEVNAEIKKAQNKSLGFCGVEKSAADKNICTISGCQDSETSLDVFVDGKRQGAMTWALLKALQEGNWTYKYDPLITKMRTTLQAKYPGAQTPALCASKKSIFAEHYMGMTFPTNKTIF